MRIGVSLDESRPGPDPLDQLTVQLERAASDGFASAWMSNIFGVDALTALAVVGSRVPGIDVGTAVVPTYPRHAITLAQQAMTVQSAVDGRLTLGVGLSHQIVIEAMFGYSFARPARHMREYLSVLLPLLHDGNVSFKGETLSAQVSLSAPRAHPVPVLLAALAPQMLHLAGAVADGTILWMTGPATIASHIVPSVNAAAESAGRPAPRVVCILPVCVTDDVAGARQRAADAFSIYGQLPSYRAMLDREGVAGPADVAIVGSEDRVGEQIQALADAGVTEFVGAEYSGGDDGERTRSFLKSLCAAAL